MSTMLTGLTTWMVVCCLISAGAAEVLRATCDVEVNSATAPSDRQPVTGTVDLQQDGDTTTLTLALSGFDTTDNYTTHGFHIHTDGNLTVGCQSTGGHYNPLSQNHGAPTASVRHVGDLGNIEEDASGEVSTTITDTEVSLSGDYSVMGRAIVIHAQADDLGLGGESDSLTTGHAGARLACCIITANGASANVMTVGLLLICLCLGLLAKH